MEINAETFTTVEESHQIQVVNFGSGNEWDDARLFNNTGLFEPSPVLIMSRNTLDFLGILIQKI